MIKSRGGTHYILRKRDIAPILRGQALNIAIAVSLLALLGAMILIVWLSITSPDAIDIQRRQDEYFKKLEYEQSLPASQRAWKRLHRKHGQPGVVIYEPGETPYYIDKSGRKCRFI